MPRHIWTPKRGDTYFYVKVLDTVGIFEEVWNDHSWNFLHLSAGNCFPNRRRAKQTADYVSKVFKLHKKLYLRDERDGKLNTSNRKPHNEKNIRLYGGVWTLTKFLEDKDE